MPKPTYAPKRKRPLKTDPQKKKIQKTIIKDNLVELAPGSAILPKNNATSSANQPSGSRSEPNDPNWEVIQETSSIRMGWSSSTRRKKASNENRTPVMELWRKYSKTLISCYIESHNLGRPDPTMTTLGKGLEDYDCECSNKTCKEVTFYFLHAQVKKEIQYCSCCPLASRLLKNQFMPSSTERPGEAY
jgi:hypothetical protein